MNPFSRWMRSQPFRSPALWLAVVSALVVCALAWRWVDFSGSDAGPVNERLREIEHVYLPAVSSSDAQAANHWITDTEFAARAWKMGWLALNGQWDTRVVAAASAVLHAGAWALLLALVAGKLRELWHYGLVAVAAVSVLLMPRAGEFWTSAATAWSGWLLLLSILQLGMQTRGRPCGWLWWGGWLTGVLNVIGAKEGGAAALVLTLGAVWCLREPRARSGRAWLTLTANAGLCAGTIVLWMARGPSENYFFENLQTVLRWPHGSLGAGVILLLPALVWLLMREGGMERSKSEKFLSVLAGWSLAQPVILAMAGAQSGAASWGVMGTCILINAVCVIGLAGREAHVRRVFSWVFVVWALAAVYALPQVGIDRDDTKVFHDNERWREAWLAGDAGAFAHEESIGVEQAREFLSVKHYAGLKRRLPASLREPLVLEADVLADDAVFRVDGVPLLEGEAKGLPSLGTRMDVGAGRSGEFASRPISTEFPLLRLWVAGEGSAATVRLRTENGRVIAPLQEPAIQAGRWVRMNFEAPGEAFRVVAKQADAHGWSAIAGPVEAGMLSWAITKIVSVWGWLLGGAVLWAAAGVVVFIVGGKPTDVSLAAPENHGASYRWLPWIVLGVYAWMVAQAMSPSAGGSDSSGYLNAARLFTEHRTTMPVREAAGVSAGEFGREVFMPLAFKPTARAGEITTVTAIGVPVMYAVAEVLMPLGKAVFWVIMGNALLGIAATRLLAGVFGLPRNWSWVAAGIIALSPQFLFIGFQALSDGPSLAWVTLAVYFAWRSRERMALAWLAGAATAMAVLVRPSNVLCVLPVLACLPFSWRGFLYWIGGGVPGGIFQAWYSWKVWGNPLTSGYGDVAEAFRLEYLPENLKHYLWWLPVLLTPVVVLAPGVFFLRSVPGRVRGVLALWAGVFLGFYAFFRHTHDAWWFLRFILPAFPALITAALLVLRWIGMEGPARRWSEITRGRLAGAGVTCVLAFLLLSVRQFQIFFWMRGDRVFERAGKWLNENVPSGSTVLSVHGGGTVIYYTDLPVVMYHHDFVRESPRFAQALAEGGRPVYALMFHFERPGGRPDFLGPWQEVASFNQGDARIWKWLGSEKTASANIP